MAYVVVTNRPWYKEMAQRLARLLNNDFILIDQKEKLTVETLKKHKPKWVFFPHWSYLIPAEIYENFECIIFHMTDLPFGRGGSPLQNLISRGIYETKISALKCQAEIDAGPIYLKAPLSLYGTAEEIYMRASRTIEEMICLMIKENPAPNNQEGQPTVFRRRKPEESNIEGLNDLQSVFDNIRMVDAEGYPKAFLDAKYLHFEFERASWKEGRIKADVTITLRKDRHE